MGFPKCQRLDDGIEYVEDPGRLRRMWWGVRGFVGGGWRLAKRYAGRVAIFGTGVGAGMLVPHGTRESVTDGIAGCLFWLAMWMKQV